MNAKPWQRGLEPVRELQRELGRVLEPFQHWLNRPFPAVNIDDLGDRYLLTADVPGLTPGEVDLTVSGVEVRLRGERGGPPGVSTESYRRQERSRGAWERVLQLPGPVDGTATSASVYRGVLTILLPKAEPSGPQRIVIRSTPE